MYVAHVRSTPLTLPVTYLCTPSFSCLQTPLFNVGSVGSTPSSCFRTEAECGMLGRRWPASPLAAVLVRWDAQIVTNLISSPPTPRSSAAMAEPAQLTESTEAVALFLPLTSPDHVASGRVKCWQYWLSVSSTPRPVAVDPHRSDRSHGHSHLCGRSLGILHLP